MARGRRFDGYPSYWPGARSAESIMGRVPQSPLWCAFRPTCEDAFEENNDVEQQDAEGGHGEEDGEHQGVVAVDAPAVEKVAKAATVGGDDLHQVGADEGERDGDFERAEEFRERFGQGNFLENR